MANAAEAALQSWHRGPEFRRFLADLVGDALAQLRNSQTGAIRRSLADLRFDADGLDIDSLERVRLATSVAEALQFAPDGSPDRLLELDRFEDWIDEARRCLPTGSSGVGFRTSGSTGQRKLVVHGIDVLAQEIDSLAAIFADRRRIVSVVPAHHIYGFLFTVLLPLRLGIEVVDARSHAPPTLRSIVEPGDLLVAVPSTWQMMIGGNWPGNIDGASSGAPCPVAVAEGLCGDGLHRLVEIYGSTETSGIGWRDDGQAPFRLFAHLERTDDDTVARLPRDTLRHYQLPDVVSWSSAKLLTPVRRRDGAVQVGGVNVSPEVVRSVLVAHPNIADAAVRLMRPEEGERLKAFIVATDRDTPIEQLRTELERWVAERLQPMARPRSFTFDRALPMNAMGKPTDWPIA
jgi:long-chain acyl-CoA synthetase